mgnify:CR=1 FL=1
MTVSTNEVPPDQTAVLAELEERRGNLPFWRRPRRLRRQITGTLIITALVAVALFGALNFFAAERLLLDGTKGLLDSESDSRAQSTELGAARLLSRVSSTASDRGIVSALDGFSAGFDDLAGTELDARQTARLDALYEERVVAPINELGVVEVSLDDVVPETSAGRWVQYHYTTLASTAQPDGADSAPPSTSYDDAIAEYDGFLTSISETFGGGDLLLIDRDGVIVYSAEKHIDLGTSLVTGPYAGSSLAELVNDDLGNVRAGDAVLSDFAVYVPAQARPVLFSAAAIRNLNEVVGTLAIEIPLEAIDAITSSARTAEGLDEIDTYIVAGSRRLQSTPASWVQDPQAYLDGISDDETRELIEALGSPVGVQEIDTKPVNAAIDGTQFNGVTDNAAGQRSYSASTTIDVPGVTWALVTEVPISAVRDPLVTYLVRLGIVAIAVLVLAAVVGFVLARRLTRPIPIAVRAAQAVAEGERHLLLPPLGRDEFGDLGRRLTLMASTLERQEQALADEFENKRELLLSVLPPQLVREDGEVSEAGNLVDIATVIAVVVVLDRGDLDDDDTTEALATATGLAERLASDQGIDRIRVAADRLLFVAGAGTADDGADLALEFASLLVTQLHSEAVDAGISLIVHVGISTGQVATGILSQGSLTFAAWGEPVRRSLAISALSRRDEILVDPSTLEAATGSWQSAPADDVVDLDDQPIAVRSLTVEPSSDVGAS